jgi:hypothetical protein
MRDASSDLGAFLIQRGIVNQEQVEQARRVCRGAGSRLADALIQLGYTTTAELLAALAELYGVLAVDLRQVTVPPAILELVPESLARDREVLPLALEHGVLRIAMANPLDLEALQALRFILNCDIQPVLAARAQLLEAIDRHYAGSEMESVDSMLAEFSDTPRDIFETDFDLPALEESGSQVLLDEDLEGSDFDLGGESEFELTVDDAREQKPPEPTRARIGGGSAPPVRRQATVRYYYRMNPERMFPLLVVISRTAIEEAVKRHVAQQKSPEFQVALDSIVEVEPVLPGCACYPPKEQMQIQRKDVSARFHVVPHFRGKLADARVVLRQGGRVLAEVPLEIRVARQGLTVMLGALSFLLPFALMVLKHLRLDLEAQLTDGFGLYAGMANWALRSVSPELLAGVLLAATGLAYLWFRPRRRDVFWDIKPLQAKEVSAARPTAIAGGVQVPAKEAAPADCVDHQLALFAAADEAFAETDYAVALRFYESGLVLGKASARHYHQASLAAGHAGKPARALAILEEAANCLPAAEMKAAMWYNLGCFATRQGKLAEAVRYLNRAAQAGYADPEKYRSDLDLAPLRWRSDFKQLVGSLQRAAGRRPASATNASSGGGS